MTKYFKKSEFACKCGCGYDDVHEELLELLDAAREHAGIPFVINSGCRCKKHNAAVGGKPNSAHIRGYAADIACTDSHTRWLIKRALYAAGAKRIGHHERFIHVDVDPTLPQEVEFKY